MGTVSISDLVMAYEGNKQELVRDIAGIPQEGKLPTRGTDERRAYDTANRNVNRWLQGRTPKAPVQERLNELYIDKQPVPADYKDQLARQDKPASASISITGWIYYDSGDQYDSRWRRIQTRLSA